MESCSSFWPVPVLAVTSADVIGILAPIWHEKAATARKLRQRIRTVMEWAVAMDLRPDNPCDRIGPVIGAQGKVVRHMRALPHGELAVAIEKVRASTSGPAVKLALEFLVLTAPLEEVRGAVWTEIDRDEGVWTIAAPRTKGNREHRVPLSRRALEILEEARALDRGSKLVFPSVRGKPLGVTAMSRLLSTLRIAAVPHGFLSSFRDWAAEETDYPREVAEAAAGTQGTQPDQGGLPAHGPLRAASSADGRLGGVSGRRRLGPRPQVRAVPGEAFRTRPQGWLEPLQGG